MYVACRPNYAPLPYVQLLIQTGSGPKLHAQVHGPNGLMNYVLTQTIVLLFTITAMLRLHLILETDLTCAMNQGVL